MDVSAQIEKLDRIHRYLIGQSNYWSNPDLMEADKMFCLEMSDLRHPHEKSFLDAELTKLRRQKLLVDEDRFNAVVRGMATHPPLPRKKIRPSNRRNDPAL